MPEHDLRYPIGKFQRGDARPDKRSQHIQQIEAAPAELRAAVADLTADRLDTPYRPGGWTVRQVVHHLPDSHMNAYVRMKLALTEEVPTIKPYDEARWAELGDTRTTPIEIPLGLFELLQQRWAHLLRSLTPQDFSRTYRHPEQGTVSMEEVVAIYAWHGRHHVAHIASLRERNGW
jgi:DinB superfamily